MVLLDMPCAAQDPTLRPLFEIMTASWGEGAEDAVDSADEDGVATASNPYDEEVPADSANPPTQPTLESLLWQLQILQNLAQKSIQSCIHHI